MLSFDSFHKSHPARIGVMIGFALLLMVAAVMKEPRRGQAASRQRQSLTFEERVAAQRAIEEVYWRHRIWPKENPQPKPPLDEVMPESDIRAKVEDYLRKSQALEVYWQRPITGEQLQAEMERMARETKQPDVLRELCAALDNDPFVIAECLARPALAERLAHNWYASDERFHGELKRRAEAELGRAESVKQMRQMSGEYHEVEWRKGNGSISAAAARRPAVGEAQVLDEEQWREQMSKLSQMFSAVQREAVGSIAQRELINPQSAIRNSQLQAMTMGRLSRLQEDETRFYVMAVVEKGADRLKVASVDWLKESFAEWWSSVREQRERATAMSEEYRLPEIEAVSAQYKSEPSALTGADVPSRSTHTAIWTGNEMIVWGGYYGNGNNTNTGGQYNPATNTWTTTSTTLAPSPRHAHTAVWTGSRMIVWGGLSSGRFVSIDDVNPINTSGIYNPAADSWTATNTCTYSIAPANQAFAGNGGAGSVSVTTASGCNWTASSNANWVTITSGSSGAGNGAVNYSVAANTNSSPRTGTITIAGQIFIVTQSGVNPAPTIGSLSPNSATAGGTAFTLTVNGMDFVNSAIVRWNGSDRLTTFVSGAQLTASIPASDIANAGAANITVFNPTPGGGVSNTLNFTINALGLEADVSPRPNGNGALTVTDWVQLGRFAAGLETAANGNEFQRADCAPLATRGDGVISMADYVQAGRYAAGLDPVVTVGGPTAPSAQLAAGGAQRAVSGALSPRTTSEGARTIKLDRASADVLIVECDARGDENAFGFSLNFDPAQWRFVSAEAGRDASGASLIVNSTQAARGRIGFALALPAGESLPTGARQIVIARFQSLSFLSGRGVGAIEFGDLPVRREAVDARANGLPAAFMSQRERRDEIGNRTIVHPADPGFYRKRKE